MADKQQDIMEVRDGRLVINVAIDPKGVPSTSGKSLVHFSTHGNVVLNDGFTVGVNLYKRK